MNFKLSLLFLVILNAYLSSTAEHHQGIDQIHHGDHHHDRELSAGDKMQCGMKDASIEKMARSTDVVQSWKTKQYGDDRWKMKEIALIFDRWKTKEIALIFVYFHVIIDSFGNGELTQEDLDNSMDVLNSGFSPNFKFIQAGTTYMVNDEWFSAVYPSSADTHMKSELRRGGSKDLNVYFKSARVGSIGDVKGYATYPWDYNDVFDCVVVQYTTIPGGVLRNYNMGHTLVHEVGHWLGLFHVFQDGGCNSNTESNGDRVADTPSQSSPTSGCPVLKNSCPGSPGLDSINNFMDYSYDSCKNSFSEGQFARMAAIWSCYRDPIPGGCDAFPETNNCFSAITTANVKGKGRIKMKEIKVGDQVLNGKGIYDTIYSFDHRQLTKSTNFIQIYCRSRSSSIKVMEKQDVHKEEEEPLEVTTNHMIFFKDKTNPMPANTVEVGDQIQALDGFCTVTKISTVTRKGVFNPLTVDGTIIVANGIVSSTYSAFSSNNEYIEVSAGQYQLMAYQDFFNIVLKPFRYLCTTISLEFCKVAMDSSSEKVAISELAANFYKIVSQRSNRCQFISLSIVTLLARISDITFIVLYNLCLATSSLAFISWMIQTIKIQKKL